MTPAGAALLAGVIVGGGAGLLAGPVAGCVGVGYAGVATLIFCRAREQARSERTCSAAIEGIEAAIGNLRAGLPSAPAGLVAEFLNEASLPAAVAGRLDAAQRLSGELGAPLADLLERVEADLRAGQRLRAETDGALAGLRSTTILLAALPLAGIGLGASLGVDPVDQLLHTRLGAACTISALILQGLGGWWSAGLTRGVRKWVSW